MLPNLRFRTEKSSWMHLFSGQRCGGCRTFVEGEVISALDQVYHVSCFKCHLCDHLFPPGGEICYDGHNMFCGPCTPQQQKQQKQQQQHPKQQKHQPRKQQKEQQPLSQSQQQHRQNTTTSNDRNRKTTTITTTVGTTTNICVGCHENIKTGQALIAGGKSYHLWCFKCHQCNVLLTGDYMAHDELPYCEPCYHANFGVVCDHCSGFITGKVLQVTFFCVQFMCINFGNTIFTHLFIHRIESFSKQVVGRRR